MSEDITAPAAVDSERPEALLRAVEFRHVEDDKTFTVAAATFVDCSYEGDLAAVAGVPYRVGREAREEFDEEHAGVIFMRRVEWRRCRRDAGAPNRGRGAR